MRSTRNCKNCESSVMEYIVWDGKAFCDAVCLVEFLRPAMCRCGHPAYEHADKNGDSHSSHTFTGACDCVLSKEQAQNHEQYHFSEWVTTRND